MVEARGMRKQIEVHRRRSKLAKLKTLRSLLRMQVVDNSSSAINTRLWRAAKAGVIRELNWLLREPGVDVDWRHAGKEGSTALHAACGFGHNEAVSLLLGDNELLIINFYSLVTVFFFAGAGADPNAVDLNGRSPMHYCAHVNCAATFTLVAKAGGKIDLCDVEGAFAFKLCRAPYVTGTIRRVATPNGVCRGVEHVCL